ncbi:hypothetical protein [Thiococcus pfennigii]|uniref:hypothetical protein n=1 Tax=Thiococcus pfennigii TaxID=1057 RepID=UPI00190380C1|nr:hypothetical protein [Thiococcus pfennigii]MBK1699378.1 hypothetical protein [Thiococcus pfennigii]
MTSPSPAFERVNFVDGQRLAARDLQTSVGVDRRLAALHMRGLHDTWGVVSGLDVRVLNDDGAGAERIQVTPGHAYDRCGRMLLLQETLTLSPPPRPAHLDKAWFDLVIRYGETNDTDASDRECGLIHHAGVRLEKPVWRWAWAEVYSDGEPPPLARDVRLGIEVPLARIVVQAGQPVATEDAGFEFRQTARRQVRPHIAGGHLERGSLSVQGGLFAWSVVIDTSDGGFSRTPHYFVTLAEHPLLMLIDAIDPEQIWLLRFVLGPFVWVHEADRTAFRLSVGFALPALTEANSIRDLNFDQMVQQQFNAGIFAFPSQEAWQALTDYEKALEGLSLMASKLPALDWLGVEPSAECYERMSLVTASGSWSDFFHREPEVQS